MSCGFARFVLLILTSGFDFFFFVEKKLFSVSTNTQHKNKNLHSHLLEKADEGKVKLLIGGLRHAQSLVLDSHQLQRSVCRVVFVFCLFKTRV